MSTQALNALCSSPVPTGGLGWKPRGNSPRRGFHAVLASRDEEEGGQPQKASGGRAGRPAFCPWM